ncbi:hypothetical protein AgCh_018337 [Apium graveolens]
MDQIIRPELSKKERNFTRRENVKIVVGKWNVGQGKSSHDELMACVGSAVSDVGIFVVGLQEVEMGAGSRQLEGLLIAIWVRTSIRTYVGDLDAGAVARGLGCTIGNKNWNNYIPAVHVYESQDTPVAKGQSGPTVQLNHPITHQPRIIKDLDKKDRIRKEEGAKAKYNIEKRIQEEEAKLKKKARRVHVSSDSEPKKESKQEQMVRALRDLKRKVEGDMEVGAAATPFTRKLESTPREPDLKHFNFDSFDELADPEEHLNYFEQISNIYDYNDLTRCRFFASTLKGGAQKWFSRIPP